MTQFQQNAWTEGLTERYKEGKAEGWKNRQTIFYRTIE